MLTHTTYTYIHVGCQIGHKVVEWTHGTWSLCSCTVCRPNTLQFGHWPHPDLHGSWNTVIHTYFYAHFDKHASYANTLLNTELMRVWRVASQTWHWRCSLQYAWMYVMSPWHKQACKENSGDFRHLTAIHFRPKCVGLVQQENLIRDHVSIEAPLGLIQYMIHWYVISEFISLTLNFLS